MAPERWQEIKKLYQAALQLGPDARVAFLDQVCAQDEVLRRELQSLWAFEDNSEKIFETPALEIAAKALAKDSLASLPERNLGDYKVLSLLGVGGMGEVYRAHDSKLGRDVAIKLLPEIFAGDPERVARFNREAKLLAALNHPNIAAIYGAEQSGDMHFLVLELVEGETLSERPRAWNDSGR